MRGAAPLTDVAAANSVAGPPTLASSARIGGAAVANIALGLLQQWYILTAIGPGRDADALFSAFVVPNVLLANTMIPVTQVLVPLLAVEPDERFRSIAWTFFITLGTVFAILTCLLAGTAAVWVPWTLPGFDDSTVALTVRLLRVQSIAILFAPLSLVLWSIHQARSRFLAVELSTVLAMLCSTAVILWGLPRFGVEAAAAGFALKPVLQTLLLVGGLGRPCRPRWTAPGILEAWRRLRPLFLGVAYCRTDQIFDRFLASMSAPGSITLLFMAQQIYIAANMLIGKAFVGTLVPSLASRFIRSDWHGVAGLVRQRVALLCLLTVCGLVFLGLFGRPLLSVTFSLGRFDQDQIVSLWWILLALGGYFLATSPISVVSAAFYAAGNTRTPAIVSSGVYTGTLLLRGWFFYQWGILGIAVAISVQMLTTAMTLLFAFRAAYRAACDR